MAFYISIHTDNNRNQLHVISMQAQNRALGSGRLVYQEIHENWQTASFRLRELQGYTRMQLERVIRRSNPNWLNLDLHPNLAAVYQPGAKFSPNVPNRTSFR